MSNAPTDGTVAVYARDLFFRAKIEAQVTRLGLRVVRGTPAPCAVVELSSPQQVALVRRLVDGGTPVLAFGSHVDADNLRAARAAGALAVPNARLDAELPAFLADPTAAGRRGPDGPAS